MKLSEIKEMLAKISKRPWHHWSEYGQQGVSTENGCKIPDHDSDLPFIAAAPEIISELVGKLEKAVEYLKNTDDWNEDYHLSQKVLKEIEE